MSGKIASIYAEIMGNADPLEKELDRAKRSANEAAKKIDGSMDAIKKSFTTLAVGAAAATAGVVAITAAMAAAVRPASELQETQGKFDVVFRGMTDTAETWSRTLVASYAMSTTESKKYLSSLQDLIVPTGMAREEAGELSNKFVKLAADLGSFNNLPTEQVIEDIQSALQGSSETMAKYGINVKAAKVEQEVLNSGLATSKDKITDAHKAQAIYNIMMRDGADAVGDMARTSDSYANQSKKLQANIADLRVEIGQELLPVAQGVVTEFNNWWKINHDLITQDIASVIGGIASAIQTAFENAHKWNNVLRNITKAAEIRELREELGKANSELMKLQGVSWAGMFKGTEEEVAAAADKVNLLYSRIKYLETGESSFDSLTSAVDKYVDSLPSASEETEKIAAATEEAAETTKSAWDTTFVSTISSYENFQQASTTLRDQIVADQTTIADAVVDANDKAEEDTKETTDAMKSSWSDFEDTVKSDLENTLSKAFQGEFDSIGDAWDEMLDSMAAALADKMAELTVDEIFSDSGSSSDGSWLDSVGDAVVNLFDWHTGGQITSAGTKAYAMGGVLRGGSGTRDDLWLGKVGNNHILAQGGEFIVNKDATKNNLGLLRDINSGRVKGYEDGGWSYDDYSYQNLDTIQASSFLPKSAKGWFGYGVALAFAPMATLLSTGLRFIAGYGKAAWNSAVDAWEQHTQTVSEDLEAIGMEIAESFQINNATIEAQTQSITSSLATVDSSITGALNAIDADIAASMSYSQAMISNLMAADLMAYSVPQNSEAQGWLDYEALDRDNGGWTDRNPLSSSNISTLLGDDGDQGTSAADVGSVGSHSGDDTHAAGGVINSVYTSKYLPDSGIDDGYAKISLGEGVIDADTMQILSKKIRNGSLDSESNEKMFSALVIMSERIARFEKIVDRWDKIGMPGTRA